MGTKDEQSVICVEDLSKMNTWDTFELFWGIQSVSDICENGCLASGCLNSKGVCSKAEWIAFATPPLAFELAAHLPPF